MTDKVPEEAAAERFQDFIEDLQAQGKNVQLVQAPPVQTLEELASHLGCDVAQLHKTVCLNYKDSTGRHLVAVIVPASGRVDMEKVARTIGIDRVKAAQPDFIEEQTGFVPGGIPPVGFEAQRLIDHRIFQHQEIFAGGGNNLNSYTQMDPRILRELYPNAIVGDFLQQQ